VAVPGDATTITVSGTYVDASGVVASGTVTFTPSGWIASPGSDMVLPPSPVVATLDTNGAFSVVLVVTDDVDLQPQPWQYTVSEQINGVGRTYSIVLPSSLGATVSLADVAPALPVGEQYYSLVSSLQIGTVTTLASGASATASITGSAPNQLLNLGLPAGATGTTGPFAVGSAAAPSVYPLGDPDTGLFSPVANSVAFSAAGVERLRISDTSVASTVSITAPTAAVDTNTTQVATTAYVVGQASATNPLMNGTVAVGTSLRYSRQDHVHASDTSRAPLASPTFTGVPAAPTATAGTSTTQLATTAFVTTAGNLKANLASPTFTGTPAAPTAVAGTNTTQLATTAFVRGEVTALVDSAPGTLDTLNELAAALGDDPNFATTMTTELGLKAPLASPTFTGTVTAATLDLTTAATATAATSYFVETGSDGVVRPKTLANVRTEVVTTAAVNSAAATTVGTISSGVWQGTAVGATYIDAAIARLASPTFTGVPAGPTAAVDTNTTQLATTAFVVAQASATNPLMNGTVAIGTSLRYSRQDHVHASDTTRAPLASPTFTGTPAAPTAAVNTNTTQVATTAFVVGQVGTANPLMNGTVAVGTSLLYSRQDHVHASDTSRAPLASPTFTGVPAAPTAAVDTNTTQVATTAYVVAQGYLKSATAASTYVTAASPALTGVPTAPTAAPATNTTQIATTAFVTAAVSASVSGVSSVAMSVPTGLSVSGSPITSSGTLAVTLTAGYEIPTTAALAAKAPLASPTFTGTVTAATVSLTTADTATAASHYFVETATDGVIRPKTLANTRTEIVTTAAVNAALATSLGTVTVGVWQGTVVGATYIDAAIARLASPTFTGTVTAPTVLLTTADTATAATHYMVETATDGIIRPKTLANVRTEVVTTAAVNSAAATTVGTISSGTWQGTAIGATYIDAAIARLASPTFTGTPAAPTATAGTNTTQLATTAFVTTAVAAGGGGSAGVDSIFLLMGA